jgi:hypothetical protein
MSDQLHAPAVLLPEKDPADLDAAEKTETLPFPRIELGPFSL